MTGHWWTTLDTNALMAEGSASPVSEQAKYSAHFPGLATPTWGLWRLIGLTCGDSSPPPPFPLARGFREHATTIDGVFMKERPECSRNPVGNGSGGVSWCQRIYAVRQLGALIADGLYVNTETFLQARH